MCGIVGLIVKGDNGLIQQHESVFREMLYADALRGFDSTGVIGVNKFGDFGIMKQASPAAIFLPKLEGSDLWKEMWSRGKVWIGHNRKKTIGDIADETAHPFVINDEFAMVHNGTINSYKYMYDGADKCATDSEALANLLKNAFDKEDWKKELEEALGKIWGAYATATFDQKRNKVYLLRNKERPLWRLDTDNAYYFCSEPMMGQWVLTRNGYSLDKIKPVAVEEHVLHSYDLDKGMWTTEELSPKKYSTGQSTYTSSSSTRGTNSGAGGKRKAVNKQALKFLRKRLLGLGVSFWVDSYYEKNMPRTLAQGETEVCFFAQSDDVEWNHTIFADADLASHGMLLESDIYENKWRGIIEDVDLNQQENELYITVGNTKPYVKSTSMSEAFKRLLSTKPLTTLIQERKEREHKLTDAQLDAYDEAIKKRMEEVKKYENALSKSDKAVSDATEKTLDALMAARYNALTSALNNAKNNGIEVGFRLETNPVKHVWFDKKTNEVIYESPVAVLQ